MSLQAYMIVFSSAKEANAEKILPTLEDLHEAVKDSLGIPDENVLMDLYAVDIEMVAYDPMQCRKCGQGVDEGRLFCERCSGLIATGEVVEES